VDLVWRLRAGQGQSGGRVLIFGGVGGVFETVKVVRSVRTDGWWLIGRHVCYGADFQADRLY